MNNYGNVINMNLLGKKINDVRLVEYMDSQTPHILAYSGVIDFMGDEIILTIFPEEGVISDEGYTEYALEGMGNRMYLSKVKILIKSHKVILTDGYTQSLELKLIDDEYVHSVNRLTSCIIDIYASLIY